MSNNKSCVTLAFGHPLVSLRPLSRSIFLTSLPGTVHLAGREAPVGPLREQGGPLGVWGGWGRGTLTSPCQSSLQTVQLRQVLLQELGAGAEEQGSLVVHPGGCIVSLSHTHTHRQKYFTQLCHSYRDARIGNTFHCLELPSCAESLPCSSRPGTGQVWVERPACNSVRKDDTEVIFTCLTSYENKTARAFLCCSLWRGVWLFWVWVLVLFNHFV